MLGFYRIRFAKARLGMADLPPYFYQRHSSGRSNIVILSALGTDAGCPRRKTQLATKSIDNITPKLY